MPARAMRELSRIVAAEAADVVDIALLGNQVVVPRRRGGAVLDG